MIIIGCDFHPDTQTIAWVNTEAGECGTRCLQHDGEVETFYRSLRGQVVRVGMEATGNARWFERLLAECGVELWVKIDLDRGGVVIDGLRSAGPGAGGHSSDADPVV